MVNPIQAAVIASVVHSRRERERERESSSRNKIWRGGFPWPAEDSDSEDSDSEDSDIDSEGIDSKIKARPKFSFDPEQSSYNYYLQWFGNGPGNPKDVVNIAKSMAFTEGEEKCGCICCQIEGNRNPYHRGDPYHGLALDKIIELKEMRKKTCKRSIENSRGNPKDGTACAAVLTQAILDEGRKSVAAGLNVMDVRNGINKAVDVVISHLKSQARMISTPKEIIQVATIFANDEREIVELIVRAMEKVGKEGDITVYDGNMLYSELEVVQGMKLTRGYRSSHFITDEITQKCELENPLILIHDNTLDEDSVDTILELSLTNKRDILVVAEDVECVALVMLIANKNIVGYKVCAIKAPGFGENRRVNLEDLAIFTGGEVITGDRGLSLGKVQLDMLGTAKKVIVTCDDTFVLHGGGDKKLIEERCEQLRTTIERSTTLFDKEKAQERLSKLSGSVAVLKIGGAYETEVRKKKVRVTNALNAVRAAVEEGIVPGAGAALLYATKELDKIKTSNNDEKIGVQIIQSALKAPTYTIAANAGADGEVVVGKLLEQKNLNLGYNAAKGEYADMVKAGIISPLKIIRIALADAARIALADAASVSVLPATTEATIVELAGVKEKQSTTTDAVVVELVGANEKRPTTTNAVKEKRPTTSEVAVVELAGAKEKRPTTTNTVKENRPVTAEVAVVEIAGTKEKRPTTAEVAVVELAGAKEKRPTTAEVAVVELVSAKEKRPTTTEAAVLELAGTKEKRCVPCCGLLSGLLTNRQIYKNKKRR